MNPSLTQPDGQAKPVLAEPRFQVHIIRDIIGTDYSVIDTGKPRFSNGYSNSLGCWPSLAEAQKVADNENNRIVK